MTVVETALFYIGCFAVGIVLGRYTVRLIRWWEKRHGKR